MSVYADNAARFATTREQRIRELTNEALTTFEADLREARRWATRGLAKDGDNRAADLTWAAILADVARADVVGRLHGMGVTE